MLVPEDLHDGATGLGAGPVWVEDTAAVAGGEVADGLAETT
jgi:hypothetical protein